ncbi:protein translocase subunit SecF [Vampirovibrio chlorellavorus]|uniref:protein translocase subunit SecF n=1 Tax=Vampirovibrio chlorellavorus TaxID=758823 RepID=UPI0026EF4CF6|nr:protein translocase subunit SecF [Vampirovibrio chlorellavorus]
MSKQITPETTTTVNEGPLNLYKYRWLFIGISLLFLLPGIYYIAANMLDPEIRAPLKLGIDFKGGTLLEYGFSKHVSQPDVEKIKHVFDEHGYAGSVVQIQEPRVGINKKAVEIGAERTAPSQAEAPTMTGDASAEKAGAQTATVTTNQHEKQPTGEIASIVSVRAKHMQGQVDQEILKDLESQYGHITVLQKNSIGPALAKELLSNGLLALVLAYILIVGYLTYRFQFDFAVCAVVALLHDTVFLLGMFAMFGRLFNTEVDSLFITSVLTVIGFSVHDTIVVFDRIRENLKIYYTKKLPFVTIMNMSVNQTLTRSINTSLTVLLTMLALYFFGGETTRDFVLAIIIGVAAGTYSSIFNASVMLAMWRNRAAAPQALKPATA